MFLCSKSAYVWTSLMKDCIFYELLVGSDFITLIAYYYLSTMLTANLTLDNDKYKFT